MNTWGTFHFEFFIITLRDSFLVQRIMEFTIIIGGGIVTYVS